MYQHNLALWRTLAPNVQVQLILTIKVDRLLFALWLWFYVSAAA